MAPQTRADDTKATLKVAGLTNKRVFVEGKDNPVVAGAKAVKKCIGDACKAVAHGVQAAGKAVGKAADKVLNPPAGPSVDPQKRLDNFNAALKEAGLGGKRRVFVEGKDGVLRQAANAVGNAAQVAGNAVVHGAQVVGKAVGNAAQVAGNAVVHGAQAAGKAVVHGVQAAGNAIGKVANHVLAAPGAAMGPGQRANDLNHQLGLIFPHTRVFVEGKDNALVRGAKAVKKCVGDACKGAAGAVGKAVDGVLNPPGQNMDPAARAAGTKKTLSEIVK